MASILAELKTYLKTISPVTTLIGSGTAARIYPHAAKEGVALPYIVLEGFPGESYQHLGGISGMVVNRIQIDAYAATEDGAYVLAEAIRLAPLQMLNHATMGSTNVNVASSDSSYEFGFEPPVKGGAQKRYWVSRDYFVTYAEVTA